MARPIKYKTEQDRLEAAKKTGALIQEIKKTSGKTYEQISRELYAYPLTPRRLVISESMLRQYASGHKPMGAKRLTDLAEVAYELGWGGKVCTNTLAFDNYDYQQRFKHINELIRSGEEKLDNDLIRSLQAYIAFDRSENYVRRKFEEAMGKLEFDY